MCLLLLQFTVCLLALARKRHQLALHWELILTHQISFRAKGARIRRIYNHYVSSLANATARP